MDLLTGRRWSVIEQAREDGVSWEQIGEALGMSRQAAWTWYRRKLTDQERYVNDLHESPGPCGPRVPTTEQRPLQEVTPLTPRCWHRRGGGVSGSPQAGAVGGPVAGG